MAAFVVTSMLVTGTAFGNHDLGWIRAHARADSSVRVDDVTSARACLGIWGPRARDLIAPLTTDDVSDAGFPYLTARTITIGRVDLIRSIGFSPPVFSLSL